MATIPISRVIPGTRLRPVDPARVERLADSIAAVGLLNPVTVCRWQVMDGSILVPGYRIVAGLHRLEACRRLGLADIEATIFELDDLHRQLAECDENLCGTNLTAAERAMFTARRKQVYEALHPETRQGATGGTNAGKTRSEVAKLATSVDRFTADTAKHTGQSERVVQRDARRGERIDGEVLEEIAGTDLDKGVVLDALAKTPPDKQREKLARLRATKPASLAPEPCSEFEVEQKQLTALMNAWNKANETVRQRFLDAIDRPVFDGTAAGERR